MHQPINHVRRLLFAFDAIHALIQRHGLEPTGEFNGSGYLGYTHETRKCWFAWRVFINEDPAETFEARLTVDITVLPASAEPDGQRAYSAALSLNFLPDEREWRLEYALPELSWQTPQSLAFMDIIAGVDGRSVPHDKAMVLLERFIRHFKTVIAQEAD